MVMPLKAELDLALDLARQGGALSLAMQDDLTVSHKAHGLGPVSDADMAIDQLICKALASRFPDDLIISEESFVGESTGEIHKRVWFIDPIDGTSSYIMGRQDFVVMIGLSIAGTAVMGVIYQPALDNMWYGINIEGTRFCAKVHNNITIPVSVEPNDSNALLNLKLLVSRTSKSRKQGALIERLAPATLLRLSSFGLKAMMVMMGEADFYVCWSKHLSYWDTCAPQAIMAAANGTLSFIDGRPLSYQGSITHGGAIMAAHFEPDQGLLAVLKQIDEH